MTGKRGTSGIVEVEGRRYRSKGKNLKKNRTK